MARQPVIGVSPPHRTVTQREGGGSLWDDVLVASSVCSDFHTFDEALLSTVVYDSAMIRQTVLSAKDASAREGLS